MLLVLVSVN